MSASDRIETIGGSTVQHGPSNRRVYLMHLDPADLPGLPLDMLRLAQREGHGKVFAKVPAKSAEPFLDAGYEKEAEVPGYFRGEDDAVFLCAYPDPERRMGNRENAESILRLAMDRAAPGDESAAEPDPDVLRLGPDDAESAAALYREVFQSYPFPIHDPAYIRRTMQTHVAYYGIRSGNAWAALSSAEKDHEARAAELTDFASRPGRRGKGFAGRLLARMEQDLRAEGFLTGFTIARALSAGMNIVFARARYRFGGMLWNNTQICGTLEPMNIWYKPLR